MKFVSDRVEREWLSSQLDARLKAIVSDVAAYARKRWKWEFTLTSIYRTPEEDAALQACGIHCEWRAVDIRTRDRTAEEIEDIARYVNTKWTYDPERPRLQVCFKEIHGTAPHAHFQVHERTQAA